MDRYRSRLENRAQDHNGRDFALHQAVLEKYPGWSIVYVQDTEAISRKVSFRFIRITGLVILAFCAVVGVLVFFLYKKASIQILQRREAEHALRLAKEEVTRYSRELENRVRNRTEELRRLSAGHHERPGKERKAIARELHDELGQMLTALRIEAVWMWDRLKGNDPGAADRAWTCAGSSEKSSTRCAACPSG